MKKREKLKKLWKKAKEDKDLPLQEEATNLVFGNGNPETQILFIGEAPGYWEDQKGIPFVGRAGALLDQALSLIGIQREDVFVTNMLMYRPPQNRDPGEAEIDAYKPYIDGIIDTISPEIIVTLGRFSMGKFLPGVYISNVHGKPRQVNWLGRKITIMPMYHPAAALRNGAIKEKFNADFMKLKEVLEEVHNAQEENENDNNKEEDASEQMSLI